MSFNRCKNQSGTRIPCRVTSAWTCGRRREEEEKSIQDLANGRCLHGDGRRNTARSAVRECSFPSWGDGSRA